jgi:lipopolysaccharide biosynthesis glycosyltransferase
MLIRQSSDHVPVVFCFDERFAPYAAVAIASLLAHSDAFYRVYCLYPGVREAFPKSIVELCERYRCELRVLPIPPDSFSDWRVDPGSHFSPAAYYRLLIPEMVQEERAIYLDSDLVVTRGLSDLLSKDLGGAWLAGCPDHIGAASSQMELAADEPYLNSGVMLMDLSSLRQHRPMPVIRDYYDRHKAGVTWVDQCLINKFTEGRKAILEDSWNLQFHKIDANAVERVIAEQNGRAIFHFSGKTKPWMEWAPSSMASLWMRYAQIGAADAEALVQKATNVNQLSLLAGQQEAEGAWQAAARTWRSIALVMEGRVRALSQNS